MRKGFLFAMLIAMLITPTILLGQKKYSASDLKEWSFYGKGTTGIWGTQFYMKEDTQDTKGVMIVSPDSFNENIVLKYEVLTLTPSTVCVAILSATSDGEKLEIPADYDGAMSLWIKKNQNYFMAFRNAPHGVTPFIRKYPETNGSDGTLVSAKKNVLSCGDYHQIEVGRKGDLLWLKIDGKRNDPKQVRIRFD